MQHFVLLLLLLSSNYFIWEDILFKLGAYNHSVVLKSKGMSKIVYLDFFCSLFSSFKSFKNANAEMFLE